ncbi:hypothetical protein QTN25_001200 [Entamoeba marina]
MGDSKTPNVDVIHSQKIQEELNTLYQCFPSVSPNSIQEIYSSCRGNIDTIFEELDRFVENNLCCIDDDSIIVEQSDVVKYKKTEKSNANKNEKIEKLHDLLLKMKHNCQFKNESISNKQSEIEFFQQQNTYLRETLISQQSLLETIILLLEDIKNN